MPPTEAASLIASDKVEGTAVDGTDQKKIGKLERVMIDKLSEGCVCRSQLRRLRGNGRGLLSNALCQRRRESRPAWRSKSRPVRRGSADMQRGPIGPLCMSASRIVLRLPGGNFACVWIKGLDGRPVSYTHLTLPTNREV